MDEKLNLKKINLPTNPVDSPSPNACIMSAIARSSSSPPLFGAEEVVDDVSAVIVSFVCSGVDVTNATSSSEKHRVAQNVSHNRIMPMGRLKSY